LLESLRAEVAAAEAALSAERSTAGRVRKAAATREAELESQLSEAAAELAAAQRAADSRAAALAAAEDRAASAEREHEELSAELASARERLRRCECIPCSVGIRLRGQCHNVIWSSTHVRIQFCK